MPSNDTAERPDRAIRVGRRVHDADALATAEGDQGLDEGRSNVYGSEVHILELGVSYGGGIRVESEELSAVTTTLAVPPACKDRIVSACNKEMLKTLTEAPPSPNAIVVPPFSLPPAKDEAPQRLCEQS